RYTEVPSLVEEIRRRFPQSAVPTQAAILSFWDDGKYGEAARIIDTARKSSIRSLRQLATNDAALLAALHGQIRDVERLYVAAVTVDSSIGVRPAPLSRTMNLAFLDVWFRGDQARMVRRLDSAV